MAIERTRSLNEKLVPTRILIEGKSLDAGQGRIGYTKGWRDPDGVITREESISYDLSQELGSTYGGITALQVMEFFSAWFEAKQVPPPIILAESAPPEAP